MRCPRCDNKILQKAAVDGGTRLRIDGPIEITTDGTATARCHWCGDSVELPIVLKAEPAPVPRRQVRIYVTK